MEDLERIDGLGSDSQHRCMRQIKSSLDEDGPAELDPDCCSATSASSFCT